MIGNIYEFIDIEAVFFALLFLQPAVGFCQDSNLKELNLGTKILPSCGTFNSIIAGDSRKEVVYIGCGSVIKVLDVSDPSRMIEIQEVETSHKIKDLNLYKGKVFFLHEGGDLFAAQLEGNGKILEEVGLKNFRSADAFKVKDDFIYMTRGQTLVVHSLSEEKIIGWVHGNWSWPSSLDLSANGRTAYLSSYTGTGKISIFNVEDRTMPTLAGEIELRGATSLFVHEDILYVFQQDTDYLDSNERGVRLFDLENPLSLKELSFIRGSYRSGYVDGGRLHLFGAYGSLLSDVSLPTEPKFITRFSDGSGGLKIENVLFSLGDDGLRSFDVSNVKEPSELHFYDLPYFPRSSVVAKDDYLYLFGDRIRLFDISDPLNVKKGWESEEGSFMSGPNYFSVPYFLEGDRIDFSLYEMKDLLMPVELGNIEGEFLGYPWDYYLLEDKVFSVSTGHPESAFSVFDLSSWSKIASIGVVNGTQLDIEGGNAFVSAREDGLYVIDVRKPDEPNVIYNHEDGNNYHSLIAEGNLLFAENTDGISVFDIVGSSSLEKRYTIEDVSFTNSIWSYMLFAKDDFLFTIISDGFVVYKIGSSGGYSKHAVFHGEQPNSLYWNGDFVYFVSNNGLYSVPFSVPGLNSDPFLGTDPLTGSRGSSFILRGDGFTPNGIAQITVLRPDGGILEERQLTVSETGGIAYDLPIFENAPIGEYTWWAVDQTTGVRAVEFRFTVTEGGGANLTPPTLATPADQEEITASTFRFEWSHPFEDEYELVIRDQAGNIFIESERTSAKNVTVDLSSLEPGKIYKWNVVVYALGASIESAERFFTYQGAPTNITPPTPVSPGNNATITGPFVTFTWDHPFNDEYELVIKRIEPDGSDVEVYRSNRMAEKQTTVNLSDILAKPGDRYKWYVVVHANGQVVGSVDWFLGYAGPVITDEYRVFEIPAAPNPEILKVPFGGTGYAWFILKQKDQSGDWVPVSERIDIMVRGVNGTEIMCETNVLPYHHIGQKYYFEMIPGAFAIPVESEWLGSVGSGPKTFTIHSVRGMDLVPENRKAVEMEVVPYYYSTNFSYRLYGDAGLGGTTGIFTGTGFIGGGKGGKIEFRYLDQGKEYPLPVFSVVRKQDMYTGVEAELGIPKLVETDVVQPATGKGSLELKGSAPYEEKYEFNLSSMSSEEALLASYLFWEGGMSYMNQMSLNFWQIIAEFLISRSEMVKSHRVSDQAGFELEGMGKLSAGLGVDSIVSKVGWEVGASLGGGAHVGASILEAPGVERKRSFYTEGEYDFEFGLGPKWLAKGWKNEVKWVTPIPILTDLLFDMPANVNSHYQSDFIVPETSEGFFRITHSIESTDRILNIYDLPGEHQRYSFKFDLVKNDIIDLLEDTTQNLKLSKEIGTEEFNIDFSSVFWEKEVSRFLEAVYANQKIENSGFVLGYGHDGQYKTDLEANIEIKFPIPAAPPYFINLGFGGKVLWGRDFDLARGYWLKGTPILQKEMPNPPMPPITFKGIMNTIWEIFVENPLEFERLLLAKIVDTVIEWVADDRSGLRSESQRQFVELDKKGSSILLSSTSIPGGIDSLFCRHWLWPDEALGSQDVEDRIVKKRYHKAMRSSRESVVGMKYGIGGFFSIEPHQTALGGETILTLAYSDSETFSLDESTLGIYKEDESGNWEPIASEPMPDVNAVKAAILETGTYTIAPIMPNGEFDLFWSPQEMPNDGVSVCTVSSSPIQNNDGTIVPNGTLFTVAISKGEMVSPDANLSIEGVQLESLDGRIEFGIRDGGVAFPIKVAVSSVEGSAFATAEIPVSDENPPISPTLLDVSEDKDGIRVLWQQTGEQDLAGYKIWFDTDESGPPYDGVFLSEQLASPVLAGLDNSILLPRRLGEADSFFVSITAIDIAGNSSPFSNEIAINATIPGPNFSELQANASGGPDIVEGAISFLAGKVQNANGEILWQWSQIGGQPVELQNPNSPQPSFIAPDVPKNGEVLSFQLTVTDSTGATASDTVDIYVAHDGPGDENGTGCFIDALPR